MRTLPGILAVLLLLTGCSHRPAGAASPAPTRSAAITTGAGRGATAIPDSIQATEPPAPPAPSASPPSATTVPAPTPIPVGMASCQPAKPGAWASCRFVETAGASLRYYLFIPPRYDPRQAYPLVLLLHGGGEKAQAGDSDAVNRERLLSDPYAAVWGSGTGLKDDPSVQERWPSFVVVPQVEDPNSFVSVPSSTGSYTLPPEAAPELRMTKEIVDSLQQQYPAIDPTRRYVTGLSMGGYATWELLERWPGYFAAAGPMCGAGDPALAGRLVGTPIWAFHGAEDSIVPVSGSREMIEAIRAAGGDPRYTEYPDQDHGVWVFAYSITGAGSPQLDFYSWLFAQKNPAPAPIGGPAEPVPPPDVTPSAP